MRPKPSKDNRSASPIEAQKRALAEQESKLHEAIERRQKLIEDAPRLAEQAARRRREELLARKSRSEARFGANRAIADPRYDALRVTTTAPQRQLRKDRNQGMYTFFLLLLILGGVLAWLYSHLLTAG